jgi:hypothetical protein
VRDTEEVFELINDLKNISENINFYIPIYSGVDIKAGDIEFFEKYEIPVERAGRKIIISMKNSARPQSPNKRRKLIRS